MIILKNPKDVPSYILQSEIDKIEKSKTCHVNCDLFLRKERGICFQNPK